MFGPNVTIATAGHPILPVLREQAYQYNAPVHIGKNCWLGQASLFCPASVSATIPLSAREAWSRTICRTMWSPWATPAAFCGQSERGTGFSILRTTKSKTGSFHLTTQNNDTKNPPTGVTPAAGTSSVCFLSVSTTGGWDYSGSHKNGFSFSISASMPLSASSPCPLCRVTLTGLRKSRLKIPRMERPSTV